MEELVLFNRRLKLVDGEIYLWKQNRKTPYWGMLLNKPRDDGYIRVTLCNGKASKKYYYHRIVYKLCNPEWDINDTSSENQIDHFDNNKSNNKIENLRVVTNSGNAQNIPCGKGYSWNKSKNMWRGRIKSNNKTIYLGYFDTEEEARNAYLAAKKKYHIKCYTIF